MTGVCLTETYRPELSIVLFGSRAKAQSGRSQVESSARCGTAVGASGRVAFLRRSPGATHKVLLCFARLKLVAFEISRLLRAAMPMLGQIGRPQRSGDSTNGMVNGLAGCWVFSWCKFIGIHSFKPNFQAKQFLSTFNFQLR